MTGVVPISYFSSRGTIYYTPSSRADKTAHAHLPIPPCRPRQRRPHSIHITRLPAGFVPYDLRLPPTPPPPKKPSRLSVQFARLEKLATRENAKRVLGSVLATFSSNTPSSSRSTTPDMSRSQPSSRTSEDSGTHSRRSTTNGMPDGPPTMSRPAPVHDGHAERAPNLARDSVNSIVAAAPPNVNVEAEKPICSANGVSCYIALAEPTIFLSGLDHDGTTRDSASSRSALLRGKLQINITKSAKIKAITLKFTGRARTEWPEGIPPAKMETFEEDSLRTEHMPFFNATYEGAENGYGLMCTYTPRDQPTNSSTSNLSIDNQSTGGSSTAASTFSLPMLGNRARSGTSMSNHSKRLSLQSNQSRSFTKGDSPFGPTPQMKGYKVFHPGLYEYSFELPIDNNSPETTKLPSASVKWQLEAMVERAGAFKVNLQGFKEIPVIRAPSPDSLELSEPISISRTWDDQLHYQIMISGKSFPVGGKIPIAFRLTPLAKVQVHKIKVYITESCEYFTSDRKVTRKDPTRKILILEKIAGKPLSKEYQGSDVRVISGGEFSPTERATARAAATRQRQREAERNGTEPEPLPEPSQNLLGDIDLGLEKYWTQTEMEMDVQIPTCEMIKKNPERRINHACTWKNVQLHHWIKIIMRISRADESDPSGKKRRHFEISIDSPITFLDCQATTMNLALPQYSDMSPDIRTRQRVCGCPNAASATPTIPSFDGGPARPETYVPSLTRPPQAHLSVNTMVQRPMHMLRNPSYNPPDFDADEPPPPLSADEAPTPPPMYDSVIGTPSFDGYGDYFARFNEMYDEGDHTDDEDVIRAATRGRVNIPNPRTPGTRVVRSMDIDRNFMFNPASFSDRLAQQSVESSPSPGTIDNRASFDNRQAQSSVGSGIKHELESEAENELSAAAV